MRSAVIILEDDRVALIERVRDGHTYYVFPGGTDDWFTNLLQPLHIYEAGV